MTQQTLTLYVTIHDMVAGVCILVVTHAHASDSLSIGDMMPRGSQESRVPARACERAMVMMSTHRLYDILLPSVDNTNPAMFEPYC